MRLAAVRYVSIADEPDWDRYPDADSLDFGVNLVADDGRTVGLTWGDSFFTYALEVEEGGTPEGGYDVWDVSATSRWEPLLGTRISGVRVKWIDEEDRSVELSPALALALLGAPLLAEGSLPARPDPTLPRQRIPLRLRAQRWLGLRLLDVRVGIERRRRRPEPERLVYPDAIELAFGARRVWASVLEITGVDRRGKYELFQSDKLLVVFDEDVAREFGLVVA